MFLIIRTDPSLRDALGQVSVFEWFGQIPDLKPKEHLRRDPEDDSLSTFTSNLTKLWRICTNPGAICARTVYTTVTVLLKVPSEFDYFCKWDLGFLNAFPKIYKTILPSLVSECRLLDFDLQRHFRLGKVLCIAFRSLSALYLYTIKRLL